MSHKERAEKVTSDGACRSGSRGMIFNCRLLLPLGYNVHINVHTTLQNTKFVYIFVEGLKNSFEFVAYCLNNSTHKLITVVH